MQEYRSYDCESDQYSSGGQGYYQSSAAQTNYQSSAPQNSYQSSQAQDYYQSAPVQNSYKSSAAQNSYQSSPALMSAKPTAGGYQVQKKTSFNSSETLTVFGSDPFCEIQPSSFPPGTDPNIVQCFNRIDKDGNGCVDDRELQSVLSSCNHAFSLRTVHLLMFQFTHSNQRRLGPKEFVPLMNSLKSWRASFVKFDRDRNGSIDSMELGNALNCLGFSVNPMIVNLLVAKFSKNGGRCSLQYDNFIECCLTVKGLTDTFNVKADQCGKASFHYQEFLLNVLPFIIA